MGIRQRRGFVISLYLGGEVYNGKKTNRTRICTKNK